MNPTAVSATLRCPVCSSEYPSTKKFCRLDGAGLVEVPAAPSLAVIANPITEISSRAVEAPEVVSNAPVAEAAAPLAALQSAAELVLTVPAAPMIVSTPQPVTPIAMVEGPSEVVAPVVKEQPTTPLEQPAPSVVNLSRKNQSLRPVLMGIGVGVLILALVAGVVYLMKQRREPVPPPVVEVTKSPAQLEGEINRALRDAGLNEVFSAVDDRFGVLLKGTVPTEALKVKAIETARSFPTVTEVKDMVFVVEQ